MSLLNEMLRDLDKRAVESTGVLEAVEVDDSPRYSDRKFNYFLLFYICFVVSVSGALFFDFDIFDGKEKKSSVSRISNFGSMNVFGDNVWGLNPIDSNHDYSGLSLSPLKPQGESGELEKKEISELIQKAKLAVNGLRLTLPNKDNALYYVGQVLQLDPSNAEVKSIMQTARERYLDVFKKHLNNNRKERAKVLIDRAHLLSVDHNTISWMTDRLIEATAIDDKISKALGGSVAQGEIKVIFSEETSEQKIIELAVLEMNSGKPDAAIDMLRNFIEVHPAAYSVILRLFEMYILTKDFLEAGSLADDTKAISPVLNKYFNARVHAEKGRLSQALYILSQLNYRDIPLHSILAYRAALAQKLENTGSASRDYAYLVRVKPLNSSYWLGLALALEAEKRYHESLKAYMSVKKISDQPAEVSEYVARKIQRLSAFQIAGTDKW